MGARAAATLADNLFGLVHRGIDQYDPRFSPRKSAAENERLSNLEVIKEVANPNQEIPTVKLSEFEGRDFITSMSDRTDANGQIVDINGVPLNRPVKQHGGQDYMFENDGQVWASGDKPVQDIMNLADGDSLLYLPWRMSPTGGDFSTSTGETMLAYAQANMTKAQKADLNKAIRDYRTVGGLNKSGERVGHDRKIEGWKGIDDPSTPEVWANTPDAVRKEIMDKVMDKQFRDSGGLSLPEARLANTDPRQVNAREGGLMNVGEVFGDQPIVRNNDHPSYPNAVPGRGIGKLDEDIGVFELLPEKVKERAIPDPLNPRSSGPRGRDTRVLEVKPYRGTITPEILQKLSDRGVDVGNIDPALLAALGLASAGAAGGSLLFGGGEKEGGDKAGKYVDSLFEEVLR